MRFLMLMIPRGYASPARMMRFNEELTRAGVLLAVGGLHPPSHGARVRFDGIRPRVAEGALADAPGAVGGYWLIQAKSRDEAIEWASRCPAADGDVIEVRQVHDLTE
jgi:hypothetical protein